MPCATTSAAARTGRAARATWLPPATGHAASMPTRTRCATTSGRWPSWAATGAPDHRAIAAIREHMGDLLAPIGRREEAQAHFDAVLAWARAAADNVREGRLQRKLAGLHWDAGERERSFGCLRDGLWLLECRVAAVGSDIDSRHRTGPCVPRDGPALVSNRRQPECRCLGAARAAAGRARGRPQPGRSGHPPGRGPARSRTRSTRSAPRSPGSGEPPKRSG